MMDENDQFDSRSFHFQQKKQVQLKEKLPGVEQSNNNSNNNKVPLKLLFNDPNNDDINNDNHNKTSTMPKVEQQVQPRKLNDNDIDDDQNSNQESIDDNLGLDLTQSDDENIGVVDKLEVAIDYSEEFDSDNNININIDRSNDLSLLEQQKKKKLIHIHLTEEQKKVMQNKVRRTSRKRKKFDSDKNNNNQNYINNNINNDFNDIYDSHLFKSKYNLNPKELDQISEDSTLDEFNGNHTGGYSSKMNLNRPLNENNLKNSKQFKSTPDLLSNHQSSSNKTLTVVDSGTTSSSSSSTSTSTSSSTTINNKKLYKPTLHQRIRNFFTGKSNKSHSVEKSQIADSGFHGSRGIKIKYIKYNASHRKARRQIQSSSNYQLLEPIVFRSIDLPPSLQKQKSSEIVDNLSSIKNTIVRNYEEKCQKLATKVFNDFGVKFISKQPNKIVTVEFEKQHSLTYCDDLTKNLALAFQTLALFELEADINQLSTTPRQVSRPNFFSSSNQNNNHYNSNNNSNNFNINNNGNNGNIRKTFSLATKLGSDNILIFGGNLTYLHIKDNERNKTDLELPSILKYMIEFISDNGLEEEGVFRIPGTKNRLKKLEEELTDLYTGYYRFNKEDQPEDIRKVFKNYTIHDVASLLKLFLRQLSPPLMTNELMDIFLSVPDISNIFVRIKILNLLMLTLNDTHRNSLNALLNLFNKVILWNNHNKITLDGITTLIAVNLFQSGPSTTNINNRLPTNNRLQVPSSLPSNPNNDNTINNNQLGQVQLRYQQKNLIQNHRRISISSQSVNEISPIMAAHLERTNNSLDVLKLLINLQPILFHIPPYLERQTHDKDKKAQVDQLI